MNKKTFLIVVTFLVGTFSIIYELLISTTSSYFLGNSVKQFSLVIGFYMASMGLGAYFSKAIKNNLIYNFIVVELVLGLVGALSVPLCYLYFLHADYTGFNIFVFGLISLIGILTGLEVPLLTRILESDFDLKENISNILTFDYLGALLATIAFPFFLIPFVGIYKSSLAVGSLNLATGIVTFLFFKEQIKLSNLKKRLVFITAISVTLVISVAIWKSKDFLDQWNQGIFKNPVVYHQESSYQDITVTNNGNDFRLYLNGAIQFSSLDEYRYHEFLCHLPLMHAKSPEKVLILGGGEGLAVREVLKHKSVKQVDLVDIDPAITRLSKQMAFFKELNKGVLESEKVTIHNDDAFVFLLEAKKSHYDVIICDLPDPNTEGLAKLYSNVFYRLAGNTLKEHGVLMTQATSPSLAPDCFWCIEKTLASVGFEHRIPYHTNVPSFGDWGFVLASKKPLKMSYNESIPTKYLDEALVSHSSYFAKDMRAQNVEINTLDRPVILDYYLEHWNDLNFEPK